MIDYSTSYAADGKGYAEVGKGEDLVLHGESLIQLVVIVHLCINMVDSISVTSKLPTNKPQHL